MNVKRFLGLGLFTYLFCAAVAVGFQKDTPPDISFAPVPVTITLSDLTPQQLQDRAEELTSTTSTSTTSTSTSTQPPTTVVMGALTFKCSEWFPTAISVGWPNDIKTLTGLSHLLWKETRCQNVDYKHPRFNGHDHGLIQSNEIHRAWAEELFNMPFEESMSDPTLNLRFGWLLYQSAEETWGCGFHPWGMC
jgi:hypothetical protein